MKLIPCVQCPASLFCDTTTAIKCYKYITWVKVVNNFNNMELSHFLATGRLYQTYVTNWQSKYYKLHPDKLTARNKKYYKRTHRNRGMGDGTAGVVHQTIKILLQPKRESDAGEKAKTRKEVRGKG